MAMELLLSQIGAKMTHVPYQRRPAGSYNDLVGGRLDMQVITFSNAQPMLKTDKLRALGRHLEGTPSGLPQRADGRGDVGARLRRRIVAWLHRAGGDFLPPCVIA